LIFVTVKTQLRRREAQEGADLPADLPPLLRRLYALRGVKQSQELERGVRGLLDYKQLDGIDDAVKLLRNALSERLQIMIVGDFDADGATSTALTVLSLRSMGYDGVKYLVPNRFEDGYGLSPEVVEQAAARGAQLILTVDNGISSHAGVELAHEKGIQVLITDHHLPGETLPAAEAIINPNLHGCAFPSKSLAGVGVAFYLMLALRSSLRENGWFEQSGLPMPNLAEWPMWCRWIPTTEFWFIRGLTEFAPVSAAQAFVRCSKSQGARHASSPPVTWVLRLGHGSMRRGGLTTCRWV
jgi:single-stranded-DNA-specific exonuclease